MIILNSNTISIKWILLLSLSREIHTDGDNGIVHWSICPVGKWRRHKGEKILQINGRRPSLANTDDAVTNFHWTGSEHVNDSWEIPRSDRWSYNSDTVNFIINFIFIWIYLTIFWQHFTVFYAWQFLNYSNYYPILSAFCLVNSHETRFYSRICTTVWTFNRMTFHFFNRPRVLSVRAYRK